MGLYTFKLRFKQTRQDNSNFKTETALDRVVCTKSLLVSFETKINANYQRTNLTFCMISLTLTVLRKLTM